MSSIAGSGLASSTDMSLPAFLSSIVAAAMVLPQPPSAGGLFDRDTPLVFTLKAPLQQLFDRGVRDESYAVDGTFAIEGETPVPVRVSVRGNTSKRDTECSFPKLKIKFTGKNGPAGIGTLKVGSHCGEAPGETLTGSFGRLANERSPWREVTVYRLLEALGVPALRARDARITYEDTSPDGTIVPSPLTRNALVVEDDDEAMARMGASAEINPERFSTARELFAPSDTARIAFAEALIGNFDWCLAFTADDTYRCDARRKVWNLLAFSNGTGAFPVMKDFDLAGPVVGRHTWFDAVYARQFVESGSTVETEVVAQVQRTRSLFTRHVLDAARQEFLGRRAQAYDAVRRATVDQHGRELAMRYLDAFYAAIATDQAFYRPVVARPDTHVYVDASGSKEACEAGDAVPVGTPVVQLSRSGEMAQVRLLDVMWHWTEGHECRAAHTQPVWIPATSISADYPAR